MTAWYEATAKICERIADALDAMGYQSPVAGRTKDTEALLMIAAALEDIQDKILGGQIDDIRSNIQTMRGLD